MIYKFLNKLYLEVIISFIKAPSYKGLLNIDTGEIEYIDEKHYNLFFPEKVCIRNKRGSISFEYEKGASPLKSNVIDFKPGHLYFNLNDSVKSIAICGIYKGLIGLFCFDSGNRYYHMDQFPLEDIKQLWYEIC